MAPEWEAMGVDHGIGVNTNTMPPPAPSSMSHFYGGDLSFFPPGAAKAGEAPPASGSSFNLSFADDFAIPSEEAAELEWLSNFMDDSYPGMPNYMPEVAAAAQQQINKPSSSFSSSSSSVSSTGARTKRSRGTTSSGLLPSPSQTVRSSGGKKNQPPAPGAGPGGGDDTNNTSSNNNEGGGVRRCTHCASEKTPQWRTGPLGPKTLCNACGVRYKSGRLVPEYRPAASPTFVLTQHSNSHRKVMELRRQKELLHLRGAAAGSSAAASFRDYGLC